MKNLIVFNENGYISYSIQAGDTGHLFEGAYEAPDDFEMGKHYALINNVVVEIGSPPTKNHIWRNNAYELDTERLISEIIRTRSGLLRASDWTQLSDVSQQTRALWLSYRQALRDITTQPGYPVDVVWPTLPT